MHVPGVHLEVPANGGPMIMYLCRRGHPDCSWNEPLRVLLDDEEVPGTFVHHDQDYTFIPEEPLVVGAVYTVPKFGQVTAVEPVPVDLSAVVADVRLVPDGILSGSNEACCEAAADSCGDYTCWSTDEQVLTHVLRLGVLNDLGIEASRTEVRFSWVTSDGDSGQTDWVAGRGVYQELEKAAERYCVIPELRSLITGETLTLDETCVDHGDHPAPGDTELVPPDVETGDLAECPVPVEGQLEKWCEDTRARCEDHSGYCARLDTHCGGVGVCSVSAPGRVRPTVWLTVLLPLAWAALRRQGTPRNAASTG